MTLNGTLTHQNSIDSDNGVASSLNGLPTKAGNELNNNLRKKTLRRSLSLRDREDLPENCLHAYRLDLFYLSEFLSTSLVPEQGRAKSKSMIHMLTVTNQNIK